MTQLVPETPVTDFDQRLEKYGWSKDLVDCAKDYGIELTIGQNEHGREMLVMCIEFAHMTKQEKAEGVTAYGLNVDANEGAGTTRLEIPQRYAVGGFAIAFTSLVIRKDHKSGKQFLEDGPAHAHSGLFFFHVIHIDHPDIVVKFAFRSDFNEEDVERRAAQRLLATTTPS